MQARGFPAIDKQLPNLKPSPPALPISQTQVSPIAARPLNAFVTTFTISKFLGCQKVEKRIGRRDKGSELVLVAMLKAQSRALVQSCTDWMMHE